MAASNSRFVPLRWMVAGVTASIVAAAGGIMGCASRGTVATTQEGETVASARVLKLRQQAVREKSGDPAKTAEMALPPGLTSDQIAPITGEALENANLSLDAAIDDVLAGVKAPESPQIPEVTDADQDEGLRLYLQARNKLSADDPASAQEDLIASLKRDPRPAEVWRELGEAQRRMGNRSGALLAFQQAAFREPDDERTLEQIGRLAYDRREFKLAAEHLGRLSRRPLAELDPVLPYIVNAQLGRSLIGLGYVSAGVESLRSSLELPDRLTQITTRAEDFNALFRQRGELWRDVGDASMRLGRFDDAAQAYAQSASFPTLNPGSITARRVYALLREDRHAGAAWVVVEEIVGVRGRCDARTLDMVGYVAASSPESGQLLADAIAGIPELLKPNERVLAAGPLARARASALGPAAGSKVLRDYLAQSPGDEAALGDLLAAWHGRPEADTLGEVIKLVANAPLFEPKYVAALVRSTGSASAWLEAFDALPASDAAAPGAALVHARLLVLNARAQEASDLLGRIIAEEPGNTAAIVAQVRVLSALGRTEEADALLDRLPDTDDAAARYAKAVALAERDNPEAALALITPMLDESASTVVGVGAPPRSDIAMLAARLALRLDRPADAEKWYQNAIASDPMRDEAYAALMRLYSPNQALASEQKLMETAQTLRAAIPSSPTLRWLHARENAARGQFDVAERELIELDDQYPDQSEIVELLVSIWTRTGSLEHAAEVLQARVNAMPAAREYPMRLADVLAARGRSEEARQVLTSLIDRSPGDLLAMRRLETLLRDKLADEKAADELAIRRLDRSPRTFDTALERSLVLLRHGDTELAMGAADDAVVRLGNPPAEDRLARLNAGIAKITQDAEREPRMTEAAARVQSRLMTAPGLSSQAFTAHIMLLARRGGELGPLIEACDRAADTHQSMREAAYLLAIRELTRNDLEVEPGVEELIPPATAALRVAEHAAQRPGQFTATLAAVWMNAAVDSGDAESLAKAVATAQKSQLFETALDALSGGGRSPGPQRTLARAEQLGAFGDTFMAAGKEDQADEMFRLALSFNPEHAHSNNALGYRLLERGESLEEAERMIEVAYRQQPQDPAIIDSLGWARYKRGIIHTEIGADGKVVRRGAMALLAEATREARSAQLPLAVPILSDHFADSVWAAGQRQRAINIWEQAAQEAEKFIAEAADRLGEERVRQLKAVPQSPLGELQTMADSARAKARAAKEDREPPISKIFAPVNQPSPADTEAVELGLMPAPAQPAPAPQAVPPEAPVGDNRAPIPAPPPAPQQP